MQDGVCVACEGGPIVRTQPRYEGSDTSAPMPLQAFDNEVGKLELLVCTACGYCECYVKESEQLRQCVPLDQFVLREPRPGEVRYDVIMESIGFDGESVRRVKAIVHELHGPDAWRNLRDEPSVLLRQASLDFAEIVVARLKEAGGDGRLKACTAQAPPYR